MRTSRDLDRGLADLLRLVATIIHHVPAATARLDDPDERRRLTHDLETSVEALRRLVTRLELDTPALLEARPRAHSLTNRERVMAEMLCVGKSYKDIANALDLTVLSVQSRVKQIYMKVAVHTKAELRAALIDLQTNFAPAQEPTLRLAAGAVEDP